jgi:hypothetical protein
MMEAHVIEAQTARAILDRGVKYTLGEDEIVIRPLRLGVVLLIALKVRESGLTWEKIEEGEKDIFGFFADYLPVMTYCVAAAELNDRNAVTDEAIATRGAYYDEHLNALQLYELFVFVLSLSGIQAFTNTIRLLLSMTERNLSPKIKGS